MRVRIEPGGIVRGEAVVPGDKSIGHRWLILAATANGTSRLWGLPPSLDLRSTARCLAALSPQASPSLEAWASDPAHDLEDDRMDQGPSLDRRHGGPGLMVEARGRSGLRQSAKALDCGNSGTTMRLLSGVVAAAPFVTTLTGDESLRTRPMERVAVPLREMGASVRTSGGYPPVEVEGAALRGIRHVPSVPSAQVKGAVLLAGVFADGETTVLEHARTRDHTERALARLGAPVLVDGTAVTVTAFQHDGLDGLVPGDVSGAAFLAVAAALTGGTLHVSGVGLNPTRTRFLDVMERMGVRVEQRVTGEELGEPMGDLGVEGIGRLRGTDVGTEELPLVIDEVPALAALAAHASGETRFRSGAELRTKESDRLSGLAEALRSLGGDAAVEGDDLVVGGGGLRGGRAESSGDHRMAMALCVGALAAGSPCEVAGIEWASVSFPRFLEVLRALGGTVEVLG